ncbi:hypothetical protein KIN20_011475 [Parelaphostrongylus tenuis]|uniref:Glycosyltransferase family 92 protein n=1 Tax=Parelaphostrongylus tenuis TaxID=148309 RepID=A0AAD5QM26_PARTN|nr:hypothetical protein KIN20_011475 [Parelaphostrongylus tenuis]
MFFFLVIFRTEAVDLLSTHHVRKFKSGYTTLKVPLTQAVLLHSRYTHLGGEKSTRVRLVPVGTSLDNLQATMIARAKKIFPNGADFHYTTQSTLGRCLKSWRETQNNCKTPISGCLTSLINLEHWHFIESTDNFLPL